MKRLLFFVSTFALLAISASVPVAGDKDEFIACQLAGWPTAACATCTNPSRGDGTEGSTAVCLCKTQQAVLGDDEFQTTYGTMGACIDLQHSQGID